MRVITPPPRVPFLMTIGLMAFTFAACGGGDQDDSTSGQAGQAPAASGSEAESGEDDSQADGNAAPSGDAVRSAKVEIEDFAYKPEPVTIEEGGKVTWVNRDAAPHTATADDGSFDTGILEEGKLKSESFKKPGTYAYICSVHPDMHGTVEVVEAG